MFSDVLDILKGEERGSLEETIAKLGAAAISIYAFQASQLDIVRIFGVNGWESVKSVAASLGRGDVDGAVQQIEQFASNVIDELEESAGDIWKTAKTIFG